MVRGPILRFKEKPGYVRPAWKLNAHTGLPGSFEVVQGKLFADLCGFHTDYWIVGRVVADRPMKELRADHSFPEQIKFAR
jgi:hypothetical protein